MKQENAATRNASTKKSKRSDFTLKEKMKRYGNLLPFYLPAMLVAFVFCYLPMLGLVMAFKEEPQLLGYDSPIRAIFDARFNNFENFKYIFSKPEFLHALGNTLIISGLKIIVIFPMPIVLAIMLTEIRGKRMARTLEIAMYLPHFLSWITIDTIFISLLSPSGLVNNVLYSLGFARREFVTSNDYFRGVVVGLSAWKDIGWSTITYIAAITALDPALSEAAQIEGATKMQRIWYIILPGISATIAVLFIMRIGYVMDAGFEQIFILYTPFVQETGDILGTYSYRLIRGALIPEYRLSSAIGLFNSCIAMVLILGGNYISRKLFSRGIW